MPWQAEKRILFLSFGRQYDWPKKAESDDASADREPRQPSRSRQLKAGMKDLKFQ
jgi:hypothetical protein